jgi:voltage-gated potassium channel
MTHQVDQREITAWQCVMLFLSVYVLIVLLIETLVPLPAEIARLLGAVDIGVCGVFAADFFVQLRAAKNKWAYLKWGWIDIVSSIPNLPFLRIGRLARVIRILRLLRGLRSTRVIITHLYRNRARGVLTTVGLITFVLILFASIAVLNVETTPESTIKTAEDALWWSLATVTTVGYGDVYPRTTIGHIVAAVLMVAGVALFGTFTATVASFFVQQDIKHEEAKSDMILRKLDNISERIKRIEGMKENQPEHPPSCEATTHPPQR